jgi:hypothetical protein
MYNVLDKADSLEEQLNHANEALITGDSDDPPLSEKGAADMLRLGLQPQISLTLVPKGAANAIALPVCGFA